MPFPPIINLHPRMSSPGRELFRRKKAIPPGPPQTQALLLSDTPAGEDKHAEKEKLTPSSWTSANLRNMGRKSQQQKGQLQLPTQKESKRSWLTVPKPPDSCEESITRSGSVESTAQRGSKPSARGSLGKDSEAHDGEIRFSLSLTPEAILVIQKRNLEKQNLMMAKQHKCCASGDFRHRRVFPSKRQQGGSKGSVPVATLESSDDITTIVKISLLNDQYKYDDVEYEEEDGDVDETVVRKCKEWLRGVESAAAAFGKVDKLAALPHLKSS